MIRPNVVLLIACGAIVSVSTLIGALAQGTAPTRQRTVGHVTGRAIASLIKPGDAELTVVAVTSPPLRVLAPAGTSEIEWESHIADVILRIRVNSKQSAITSGGDWVKTTVSGEVEDVLKPSSKVTFSPGELLSFIVDGGDATITVPTNPVPTRVHADVPWAIPLQTSVEYLIFGWLPTGSQLVVSPHAMYELTTDGHVRSLLRDRPADEINGALAAEVLGKIRSASRMAVR